MFNPNRGDHHNNNGILFGGHGEPMDSLLNRLRAKRQYFEWGEKGHYARKCPKKCSPQVAHALVTRLLNEMKRTLYEMLLYDKENPIVDNDEAETPAEESNASEEDFTNGE